MERLGNFFEKYQNFQLVGAAAKEVVVKAIYGATGLKISAEAVVIRGYEVYLKLSAKERLQILLHKKKVLACLEQELKSNFNLN